MLKLGLVNEECVFSFCTLWSIVWSRECATRRDAFVRMTFIVMTQSFDKDIDKRRAHVCFSYPSVESPALIRIPVFEQLKNVEFPKIKDQLTL